MAPKIKYWECKLCGYHHLLAHEVCAWCDKLPKPRTVAAPVTPHNAGRKPAAWSWSSPAPAAKDTVSREVPLVSAVQSAKPSHSVEEVESAAPDPVRDLEEQRDICRMWLTALQQHKDPTARTLASIVDAKDPSV